MKEDNAKQSDGTGYKYDEIAVHYKTFEDLLECHNSAETRLTEIINGSTDIEKPDFYGHQFIVKPDENIYCLIIELYKHN